MSLPPDLYLDKNLIKEMEGDKMKKVGIFALAFLAFGLVAVVEAGAVGETFSASDTKITPELLKGLQWRSIGPAVFSARLTDIAGIPGDPNIIYIAHASAGLFKSTNGGITFESIFNDGNTLSIGAIALSPENPDVIFVGTGEGNPRNSASFGDGIYRSLDSGKSWKNLGLKETERFSRIIINPMNPEIVFAAAMGHEWGPNKERGVYRSIDGGDTWKNILYVNETTGAGDVCFGPKNPNIVYVGMYDYLRKPWHFRSGGPGSGLYRSADGGDTWVKLTDPALNNGLPGRGVIGRIGIAASRSNPNVVYARIESEEEGELWRSDDRGYTWKMINADKKINDRPFYQPFINVDPLDENRIYSMCKPLWVSIDGGKNFNEVANSSRIWGDHHALWIDPTNPSRILNGNDGGLYISNDRGETWEFVNTLPFAQAYHVSVDMAEPYNVMGGFQDNYVWRGPNEQWNTTGTRNGDWHRIASVGDGMYAEPDPRDPNIVYTNGNSGNIVRVDLRTGEERQILPYPVYSAQQGAIAQLYRFNWNAAVHMSPSDPDVVYFGGNVLFKTTDGGHSWKIISPDLTTNNSEKMKLSGGSITLDNSGAEIHCTITSISESPQDKNIIWVGTDDGNIQLTRDGGTTWTNVTNAIMGLPAYSWVSAISASPHDAGTAYVSVDDHQQDDFAPYAYITTDYGKTWEKISSGLRGNVHILRGDPKEPNLIYAGTELGIYVSFDRGKSWTDLRMGLPPLPVRDLKVHPRDNDLIIATHGRGFYILDDATPLQELARVTKDKVALFKPMRATRYTPWNDMSSTGDKVFLAKNKPYGVLISYYLSETPGKEEEVKLEILDATGKVIRAINATRYNGINRVVWDLRENPVGSVSVIQSEAGFDTGFGGQRVLPGEYKVRLSALGQSFDKTFEVRLDPRLKISQEELVAQYQAVNRLANLQYLIDITLKQIQKVDEQIFDRDKLISDPKIKKQTEIIQKELAAIKDKLQPRPRSLEYLNLRRKISSILRQLENYTGRPTEAQAEWTEILDQQLKKILDEFNVMLQKNIPDLNTRLSTMGIPGIVITSDLDS